MATSRHTGKRDGEPWVLRAVFAFILFALAAAEVAMISGAITVPGVW